MNVEELSEILSKINNKQKPIGYYVNGQFRTLDSMFGVNEYEDVVELQHEIIVK